MAWLAQIGLFIMLGLLASPSRLWEALPTALVVGGALTLIARPLSVVSCATPFLVPWRDQAFISWAGLRGAVRIVLATIPMSVGLPGAARVFDVVFLLVVLFTLLQGPTLPWVARRLRASQAENPRELLIESAPLDELGATLLQFSVPAGSRLAGVEVSELRLPRGSTVALLLRDREIAAPIPTTMLRPHDHVRTPHPAPSTTRSRNDSRRSARTVGWHVGTPRSAGKSELRKHKDTASAASTLSKQPPSPTPSVSSMSWGSHGVYTGVLGCRP